MVHQLGDLYQTCSNCGPGAFNGPVKGVTCFSEGNLMEKKSLLSFIILCQFSCDKLQITLIVLSHSIKELIKSTGCDVTKTSAGPCSVVGNVFDCRYVSDCRSRGHKFYPGPVPYFVD